MRHPVRLLVTSTLLAASALSAQDFGPRPTADTQRELLRLREAAWRTFFANDTAGFTRIVPGELLAMGWDGGPWQDRAQTLAGMAEVARGGQVIQTLEFPRTEFQQYGDVVILYTTFRLVLKSPDAALHETTGRGTEIFVRKAGRWAHTGWHLDTVAR